MNKGKNHIDELIYNTLANATADGTGIDWNAFQQKKKKRAGIFWFKIAGIFCAFALLFVAGLQLQKNAKSKQHVQQLPTERLDQKGFFDADSLGDELTAVTDSKEPLLKNNAYTLNKTSNTRNAGVKQESVRPTTLLFLKNKLFTFERNEKIDLPNLTPYIQTTPNFSDTIQKVKDSKRSFVKMGMGASYTNPSLSISKTGNTMVHKDYSTIRNNSESGSIGFQFNVVGGVTINRISPFVGIGIIQNRALANYNFVYSEKPILDLDGRVIGYQNESANTINYKSEHRYTLLNLPLGIEYNVFSTRSFDINLIGVLNTQIITNTEGLLPNPTFLNETNNLTLNQFKLNTHSYSLGLSISKNVGSYSWYVEPTINIGTNIQQVKDIYASQFNSFVITFGIRK